MDGSWVVVGPTGGEGRIGATNIGRLRQGKAMRGGVTSWNVRVFAGVVGFMGCLLLAASLLMSAVHQVQFRNGAISVNFRGLQQGRNYRPGTLGTCPGSTPATTGSLVNSQGNVHSEN